MGRYLSINVRLATKEFPEAAFRALLTHPHFRPVSLGGIEGHENGDHLFLSGYGLEDFVNRLSARMPTQPSSIEVVGGSDSTNKEYLKTVADALDGRKTQLSLSPYEEQMKGIPATFLRNHRITELEMLEYQKWFSKRPAAALYLYGTIGLSVDPALQTAPWQFAFREVAPETNAIGAPFVFLRASASPQAPRDMDIMLFTESTVWVQREPALNGSSGAERANENLRRLVSLTEAITHSAEKQIVNASLMVEGSPFLKHEADLRITFAGITKYGKRSS